jgi:acyl carrier protein
LGRIDQAVVEVDLREDLTPVTALFEEHGFQVLVDQDPLLARTDLHYLYAARKGSGRALAPGAPAVVEPPALSEAIPDGGSPANLPCPASSRSDAALGLGVSGGDAPHRQRQAGSRPPAGAGSARPVYEAPRGDLERRIAEIWEQALGLERVGAHDNFFDLGGHSLLLARVHTALRRKLETEISIIELFRFPTVASLAARLAEVPDWRDAVKPDRQRGERRRVAAGGRARSRATGKGAQA